MTDRTRLPLPEPTPGCWWDKEAIAAMHAYSDAENAALRAELEEWRFTNRVDELDRHVTRLSERVKVLEDALQRYVNHDLLTGTRGKMNEIARAALEQKP